MADQRKILTGAIALPLSPMRLKTQLGYPPIVGEVNISKPAKIFRYSGILGTLSSNLPRKHIGEGSKAKSLWKTKKLLQLQKQAGPDVPFMQIIPNDALMIIHWACCIA